MMRFLHQAIISLLLFAPTYLAVPLVNTETLVKRNCSDGKVLERKWEQGYAWLNGTRRGEGSGMSNGCEGVSF